MMTKSSAHAGMLAVVDWRLCVRRLHDVVAHGSGVQHLG
jgi:hypothetical protein